MIKLHNTQAIVISLTFDGLASNFSMIRELGAIFSLLSLPIFIFLDACHVLKVVRNALAKWDFLKHSDNNFIKWVFFTYLVELQKKSGLHAATNIRRWHLNYKNKIVKLRLTVQTLSYSVADALNFCIMTWR